MEFKGTITVKHLIHVLAQDIGFEKIDDAVQKPLNTLRVAAVGAQALITVCPFCHMMYDLQQARIERKFTEKFRIPVLHYPQLLGLAGRMIGAEEALVTKCARACYGDRWHHSIRS